MLREALWSHRSGPACRTADGAGLLWTDLHDRAARAAAFLTARGVRRAVLYGPAGPQAMTAIAACLLAGVTYVPADADTPPARLRVLCTAAGADILLALDAPPPEMPGMDLPAYPFAAAAGFSPALAAPAPVRPDDIAYILFTSGSTGAPRGVCVTYANLEHFLHWFCALPPVAAAPPRTIACAARFAFDLSVAALYPVFAAGGCLAQGAPQPGSEAELLVATPSALDLWLLEDTLPTGLRTVFCCGEVLRPATVRRLWQRRPGVRVLNAYGPTEATCAVCAAEINPAMLTLPALPVGRAAGEAVRIEPDGPDGCLRLTGPSVAAGYLDGDGDGDGGVFAENDGARSFLTADRGTVRDGYLWFLGRADDQLKYKGYRIEPAEIEAALCAVPGVRAAAVAPRRTADGRVTALIAHVAAADGAVTEESLRAALAAALPAYMVPKQFVLRPALPLTANGKIDRKRLCDADRD